jgi:uncharacterized protein YndB with AHSA1/START domain
VTGAVAVVRRVLPAPPDVVFDEWLDPVGMTEWMCPRPARAVKISLEPSVGGPLRIDIEDIGSSMIVTGEFVELDRPRRLRFTWSCSAWADPSVRSVVTVSLQPHGAEQTLMTIEHEQLPPGQVDRHQRGWSAIAAQLQAALGGAGTVLGDKVHLVM